MTDIHEGTNRQGQANGLPDFITTKDNEAPYIVIKYNKLKMIGRFICFWGPIILLSSLAIHSALLKGKLMMFIFFTLFLVGSFLYWIPLLITKEFALYQSYIIKRTLTNNVKYELQDAIYSNYTLWLGELIGIKCKNHKKSLVISYGFIKRSDVWLFYEKLALLTGETANKLGRAYNLRLKLKG